MCSCRRRTVQPTGRLEANLRPGLPLYGIGLGKNVQDAQRVVQLLPSIRPMLQNALEALRLYVVDGDRGMLFWAVTGYRIMQSRWGG